MRIVATLGPNSFDNALGLAAAGATEFRLNASHMSPAEVARHCASLRAAVPNVRCIVDLQGKKMRVANREPIRLATGSTLALCDNSEHPDAVYVPHPELFAQIQVHEHLTLDDGRLEIQILEVRPHALTARVLRGGILGTRKGLNRTEHPIELLDLSADDRATVIQCAKVEGIDFAISFVEDGREAAWVQKLAPQRRVILKIEREEAVTGWRDIALHADEIWICRGDLGAQLGLTAMARAVSNIAPSEAAVPVLMAGQVFEHLSHHQEPTRSEVCHLFDLVHRGYAGLVLSDETATGGDPANAVGWAARLLNEMADSRRIRRADLE